ncbi:periplasmic binding family protein [Clostridium argentinense CDC 2741]|uniref:Periplasmic binding family protein n=1 Tax=Clostridium argentinense CDC 2741 TaxID=1418104 RepID=A0A0C1U5D0_9CLOT|nr:ABC transporter substrate-binding protein [Clostridium argentinense]ARC86146.1 ABC transporter substrate-binding protein [Clostridium argentinense]KIE47939.1 periplasmic binding family protein [Clostridium argentinense CDC 2741]NFF40341.1 ABC transporter substrate-binding protein [Clostridium argentinense]NFP50148.1 ABC transporter substrate-binding protein [Clostridium argentinense]NFP72663.1 ABC transporter substrate-binding protein [Clostridium argentinense]
MKKVLGVMFSLLILMGLITGCNSNKEEVAKENKVVTEKTESVTENTDWPRTIVDFAGNEVVIEKKPEKIVSLWYSYPEILASLGQMPIATTESKFLSSLVCLKDVEGMETVEELGDKLAPNVEKVIELEPDIIFATTNHEEIYDTISKIAPVVVLDREAFYKDWRVGVRTIGEILGEEEEAELVIENTMTKMADGRKSLKSIEEETVALIKTWDGKSYYIESQKDPSYVYAFDKELGLGLTPDPSFVEMAGKNVSVEGLSKIQADHIFLEADISLNETILKDLENNSVWNSLKAVKNGNVHFLDISAITGGPLATEYGVSSIIEALSK